MRGRNSIERKTLLEEGRIGKKFQEGDSEGNMTAESSSNSYTLKHSQSASTLHATQSDLFLIEDRLLTLEQDYQQLMAQTKQKTKLFHKQKEQLCIYKANHERDHKEIERLQSLIGIVRNQQTQHTKTATNVLSESRLAKRGGCGSLPKERTQGLPPRAVVGRKEGSGLRKVVRESGGQFSRLRFVPSVQ